jgi:histidinol-phosphate/aromatic aminotransferase/cobyric acid decarboxylase-like protein
LITEVLKARGPYKVSAVAERAAIAALSNDRGWVVDRANDVITNRAIFRAELKKSGIASLESSANFVLVPVTDSTATAGRLERAGIRVRALPGLAVIGDAIRVAIGPWDMMQQCVDVLVTAA